jgi:perosamine synthetase
VAQVEKLDRLISDRSRVASLYAQALAGVEGVETVIPGEGHARRSWFVYPVMLDEGSDRDGVIFRLAGRGIPSKAYLPCVHLFPHFRERGWREGQFPVAESISARSLALPFSGSMDESDVALVAEALSGALGA